MNDPRPPQRPAPKMPLWLKVVIWLCVGILVVPVLLFGTCAILLRQH
jgi:hypothetical protein